MAELLIGVDIGTQGTKAGLFELDGRCVASAFVKSRLYRPRPGVVEEYPERQVGSVCDTIRQCMRKARAKSGSLNGIGIDGQMAGIIGVGRDGLAVTPYDSWLDTRCAPYIERMQKEAGDEITRKTGGPPSFNHGPKILWWRSEVPRVYKAIRAFVQPGGYAVMRLCGLSAAEAFIDTTYLRFSGFANNAKSAWDADLCAAFGVDPSKLPGIVAPHAVVGHLTAAMAARCGLKAGVPVVAGCGDTAASFLACGATREGLCVDVAGTASVFAATTARFRPDRRRKILSCDRAAAPGLWHPYACINGGGMNLEWFREELGGCLEFDELNRLAARVAPAADSPFFIPHMAGRVSPGWPRLRGAWVGLSWNHKAGHLYRALLEGVALEYGIYKQVLLQLDPRLRLKEVRVTGGGERSAAWNAVKADVLGCRVVRIARPEGAPLGSALLAGFGVRMFPALDAAAAGWIKTGHVTEPDRRLRGYYTGRLGRYAELLATVNSWSDA